MDANYIESNKKAWNDKVDYHLESDFYDQKSFREGRNSLNTIELNLLGDVSGKKILHLQCHFGQDTMSLSRMGAEVTGVDFSDKAISVAERTAADLNLSTRFICSDIYALPDALDEKFDLVFTSYGTIGWLPDLKKWSAVVSRFLKPGGRFVFAEFHPFVWIFDTDFKNITYSYFNKESIVLVEEGTYADTDAPIKNTTASWNHPLSDVLENLISAGLEIEAFREFDYSPYNCFNGMTEFEPGKFRIDTFGDKFPMVYALSALKK